MNKSLKALLMGYIKFRVKHHVNQNYFWAYRSASDFCDALKEHRIDLNFQGYNPFLHIHDRLLGNGYGGWRGFYTRIIVALDVKNSVVTSDPNNLVVNRALNSSESNYVFDQWTSDK